MHRQGEMDQSLARSKTSSMLRNTSRENREIPWLPALDGVAGRARKSKDARWR